MTYLKDRSHYEERYDKTTIELGRMYDHDVLIDRKVIPAKGVRNQMTFEVYLLHPYLNSTLLEQYEEHEATIEEWMKQDRKRDERFEKVTEPRFICPQCGHRMDSVHKRLDLKTERVRFMMKCRVCKKICEVDENGTVIKRKPIRCVKCKKNVTSSIKEKGGITEFIDTCEHCGHVEVISDEPKPEPSPEEVEEKRVLFEKDRERYCWTHLDANKYHMEVASFHATMEHVFRTIEAKK